MKKTCVISDLHLGADNAPKNMDNLIEYMSNVDCEQLVLLGDFLDRWALSIHTKPESYKDMVFKGTEKYPPVFPVINTLQNCYDRGVQIFFINGNHDFDLTQADLDSFFQKRNVITRITPEQFYEDNPELYMEHGNSVDLFNANGVSDDGNIKFPLGYFKTRLNHSYKPLPMHNDYFVSIAKEKIISDLYNYNKIDKSMSKTMFDDLLDKYSIMLLDALAQDVSSGFPGLSFQEIIIEMPDDNRLSLAEILSNYKGFVKRFYYDNLLIALYPHPTNDFSVIEWEALMYAIDAVRTFGLEYYAKRIKKNSNMAKIKSMIFGHTHMAQINNEDKYNFVLANSGCWCSNPLGPNTTSIKCENSSISMICDTENVGI